MFPLSFSSDFGHLFSDSTPYRQGILNDGEGLVQLTSLYILTSSDQLLFKQKLHFSFFTKQPILIRRSTELSQYGFPAIGVSLGGTTLSIMTLSIMTLSITTLSIITFSITTNQTRHSALWQIFFVPSVVYAECRKQPVLLRWMSLCRVSLWWVSWRLDLGRDACSPSPNDESISRKS